MGQLHNELRRTALNAALTRALGMTQGVEGLERVGETLTPTIDLWLRPEWDYLRNEYRTGGPTTVGLVAGEYSALAILNPTGSNAIITLEKASYQTAAATFGYLAIASEAVVAATLAFVSKFPALDTRAFRATLTPAFAQAWTGSDAGLLGSRVGWVIQAAGVLQEFATTLPVILSPGWAAVIQGGTVNTSILVNVALRERRALPGELD